MITPFGIDVEQKAPDLFEATCSLFPGRVVTAPTKREALLRIEELIPDWSQAPARKSYHVLMINIPT